MKLGPNQRKLVEALRSDKYTQVFEYFSEAGGFCASGLCFVVAGIDPDFEYDKAQFFKSFGFISTTNDDSDIYCDGQSRLALLNNEGATFEEIADVIEGAPDYFFERSA